MVQTASAPQWPHGPSELTRLIHEHDWAATPLGPVEDWPPSLRTLVSLMLGSGRLMCLMWGPEARLLYNEAYARSIDAQHPGALGRSAFEVWPELRQFYEPHFLSALAGEEVVVRGQHLRLARPDAPPREAWFDLTYTPVPDEGGRVAGVLVSLTDTTERVQAERRRAAAEATLREREERQTFLLRLSDVLRPLADPVAVMVEASEALGRHLGVGRCAYGEIDATSQFVTVHRDYHTADLPSVAGRYRIEDYGTKVLDTLRRGETFHLNDVRLDPRFSGAEIQRAYAAMRVRAAVVVPLVKSGRQVAHLSLQQDSPRAWTPSELRLIEDVAERTWAAVEQARAEAALQESEARFRTIVETATDYAIFTTDEEGRIETWPAGAQEVLGWTAEEAVGRPMDMTFTPEDQARAQPETERREAREQGHARDVRWHQRKDGSQVFIEGVLRPLHRADGTLTGFVKVGQDVTERRATEAALRESEERFRQFGDASSDVLWIRDAETLEWEYISPAFEEVYGTPRDSILGRNHVRRWLELIVPEDHALALDHLRRVREGVHAQSAFRILRGDGEVRWIRDTGFPILGEDGRVQHVAGIGQDATEEVEINDRLRVLVAELQHRSRNLVTVVRGVTERTLATSETLDDFRARFRPRLEALGRVNSLLSRLEEGHRITFDQLLRAELSAHGVPDGEDQGSQVRLGGPPGVPLRSATVQTFALALHELTTNALKHGALSRPEGRLEVSWALVPGRGDERRLRVEWRESGVPVEHPDGQPVGAEVGGAPVRRRQGYGRELIERALPYQLRAKTSYEITAEGVRCTIVVPVSSTLDVAFSSHGDAET